MDASGSDAMCPRVGPTEASAFVARSPGDRPSLAVSLAVRHRQDGLLVEPGSVSQLALAIEELASGKIDKMALKKEAEKIQVEKQIDL